MQRLNVKALIYKSKLHSETMSNEKDSSGKIEVCT